MEGTGMIDAATIRQDGRKLWQYLATTSACLLATAAGTALAWTAPVLPSLYKEDNWLTITEVEGSWVSSLLALGAILGAIPAGPVADKLGRKRSLLSLSIPFLLSWAMLIIATQLWLIYIARFIAGIGVGAVCVLVPTYVSEIAEVSSRGTLGAMFQLFLTIGIDVVFVLGSFIGYVALAISCALVIVAFIASFFLMPESPVWLVGQSRKPDAILAMRVLRGNQYDPGEELASMQNSNDGTEPRKASISDLIRTNGSRKALLISLGGMLFQQLSGINAVIFYTFTIFQAAGSSLPSEVASIIVAIVQTVMSGVAALIVDRAGRRPLLMISSAVMGISLIALGYYFRLKDADNDVSSLGWLPLASLTLFMVAFSIGLGPVPWMLTGELFPTETKGIASGIAVMLNWFLVFLVTKMFPTLNVQLGIGGTFWLFAAIMAAATAFTYFVVLETKGKTTEEIQNELHGRKHKTVG